jgi:hypothetical protein
MVDPLLAESDYFCGLFRRPFLEILGRIECRFSHRRVRALLEFRMSKIYVGNLPFSADEDAVRTLFAQHGTVDSVALIMDRETGRPRGFGFVEMPRVAPRCHHGGAGRSLRRPR